MDFERIKWRQLIRVEEITDTHVGVVVPGWNWEETVYIPKEQFPYDDYSNKKYYYAKVYLNCEKAEDLDFSDWENPIHLPKLDVNR